MVLSMSPASSWLKSPFYLLFIVGAQEARGQSSPANVLEEKILPDIYTCQVVSRQEDEEGLVGSAPRQFHPQIREWPIIITSPRAAS